MKRILAPHKEQNGRRYVRVPSSIVSPLGAPRESDEVVFAARLSLTSSIAAPGLETHLELSYRDDVRCHRVISSRRVEEAVETADFLKRCAEEGLCAVAVNTGTWVVGKRTRLVGTGTAAGLSSQMTFEPYHVGSTLRTAYYRYKAAAGDAE